MRRDIMGWTTRAHATSRAFLPLCYAATSLMLLVASALAVLAISPTAQGLLVYMNFPMWLWVDFKDPSVGQFLAPPCHRTRNVQLHTRAGQTLGAWITESTQIASLQEERLVLYFHGNGESRAIYWNVEKYELFAGPRFQSRVISFDYRGFGDSTGWPSEDGLLEDARTVWDWVTTPAPSGLGASPARVIIYAHSLGTAVATRLASNLSDPPAALVLEAPFTSLTQVVRSFLDLPLVDTFLAHPFPVEPFLPLVRAPVLILHGTADRVVPFSLGERLAESFSSGQTNRFVVVPGGGHSDLYKFSQALDALENFWEIAFGPR
eukprot:gb/GEZN01007799.1/.p1 GENE.gb/GEZN01007799.1/~~gb/GEZN01007799.1/.p1  ORF type:complete len:321 (+),score=18.13 gb/GEZN01007799.1/:270-1232(+)